MKQGMLQKILLCAAALSLPCSASAANRQTTKSSDTATQQAAQELGKLPLAFEQNRGQSDAQVDYLARGRGYSLFVTSKGATFTLRQSKAGATDVLRMNLAGANVRPAVEAEERLPGRVNYLLGDASRWKTGVEQFGRVRYRDVYPGVDLVYYGNQGQLEYDFEVQPGADANSIAFAMPEARSVAITKDGALAIQLANGEVRWKAPEAYQWVDGRRHRVEAEYAVVGKAVGFRLGAYDRTRPLVIDPVLVFGTYLGGADGSSGVAIGLDASHNIYVAGYANSAQYPVTGNAYDKVHRGNQDGFITKLSPDGKSLIYSTYLGGSDSDGVYAMAVDGAGNVYVSGDTISTDFPVTPGAYKVLSDNSATGFVSKLDQTGSTLIYSAEIGGVTGRAIAVDASGNAYITGGQFGNFKTTPGAYKTNHDVLGCHNVYGESFVFKMNPSGSAPVYSTYIADCEQAYGLALKDGHVYITGQTENLHPVTSGVVQPNFSGYIDAFVTELNTAGSALVYSTYLGGTYGDFGNGIAIDASGNVTIAGYTMSADYPVANAFEPKIPGKTQAYQAGMVTKLNATGTALVYSTYLGGSYYDMANAVTLDGGGNAYVAGQASSSDFPTKDAFQGICGKSSYDSCAPNAFVAKFSPAGAFLASTFYGPPNDYNLASAIATDDAGNAYISGYSGYNLPTLNAYQPTTNGDQGTVFAAKINMNTQTGCTNLRQERSVAFCTPFVNATSGPNVEISAVVNDSNPVNAIQVYVDGTFVFEEHTGKQIHSFINMAPGSHYVAVKAWDKNGSFLATRTVNVSGSNIAPCAVGDILPYVQICTPLAASAQTNPVAVHAIGASQNVPVTALTLYVDNTTYKTVNTDTLDWQGNLASGWRKLTVNGWDWRGQVFKQTVWVYVK